MPYENLGIHKLIIECMSTLGGVAAFCMCRSMSDFDEATVRATYRYLHHASLGVSEIRAITPGRQVVRVGYFDSETSFIDTCAIHNGKANLYVGIQPRPVSLFKRSPNRLQLRRLGAQDRDIQWVSTLVIDIDPVRQKNTASTRAELERAERRGRAVSDWIVARGFHAPVCNMSGNGIQLWFSVPPYPVTPENFDSFTYRLKHFEARIRDRFSGEGVKIDSIYNLSRIIKIIGTRSVKGDSSKERPHRTSHCFGEFVRHEDHRLLRAILSVPVKLIEQKPARLTGSNLNDVWLSVLVQVDTRLRELFHGTGKTGLDANKRPMDRSSSGYDYSFILELTRCGIKDPAVLAEKLAQRAGGHATRKGQSYIARTVSKALERARETASPRDERPTISLTNRDMLDLANEAWRALSNLRGESGVYRQGRRLMQVRMSDQYPIAVTLTTQGMRHALIRAAKWTEVENERVRYVTPPSELAIFLLDDVIPRAIPCVSRIASVPYFDDKECLIQHPGYQAKDATIVSSLARLEGAHLDLNVAQAKDELEMLFQKFEFTNKMDVTHTLALLLTPFASQGFRHPSPLFVVEAPVTGTGKSTLIRAISIVLSGSTNLPELLKISQHNIRKAMAHMPPLVWIPDVERLDGRDLWRALSSDRSSTHVAGRGAVWVASGENPALSREVARRAIRIRLAAPHAAPWLRGARAAHVLEYCLRRRQELMVALLSLWNRWFCQKRPKAKRVLGSFEDWCETVGGVLQCSGFSKFLETAEADALMMDELWPSFFRLWWQYFQDRSVSASDVLSICHAHNLLDIASSGPKKRSQQTRMGHALQKKRNHVIDGKQLVVVPGAGTHPARYRLKDIRSPNQIK